MKVTAMVVVQSTTSLTPEIIQYFDETLLTAKRPDPLERMQDLYVEMLNGYVRRQTKYSKEKQQVVSGLTKQIEDMFNALKKKKENKETKIRNTTERPFYQVHCDTERNQRILQGIKYGAAYGYTTKGIGDYCF